MTLTFPLWKIISNCIVIAFGNTLIQVQGRERGAMWKFSSKVLALTFIDSQDCPHRFDMEVIDM